MKAYYSEIPPTFAPVGNGAILYHYDIKQTETTTTGNDATDGRTQYECQEVTVWPPLTSNRITEAAIADRYPANYEQKLVNEYNAAALGLYDADTKRAKVEAYKAFLAERAALKEQIDHDCQQAGIS